MCAERSARGWIEIRANLERQGFDPPEFNVGLLSAQERLDLIETAWVERPPPEPAPPARDADGALTELASATVPGARLVPAGRLRLSTGKLVACDPFHPSDTAPIVELPTRDLPVVLTVVDARVAAATIVVTRPRPTKWKLATTVAVDVGVAAFMDDAVVARLEDDDRGLLAAIGRGRGVRATTRSFGRAGNVIAFPAGRGDGGYDVWIGSRGRATTRVTIVFADDLTERT